MDTLRLSASLCLLAGSMIGGQACAQQFDLLRPAMSLEDHSALICETGAHLGAGGQAHADTRDLLPTAGPERQRFLIELVTRVDVDHDHNLDHLELQTLNYLTRQQLLRQLDTDHDRQLSLLELEQVIAPKESAPSDYPYPEEPLPVSPPPPETFRNLRRFGIGIQQTPPTLRSQPFARAATFGTSPNFSRSVTKASIDGRSGGRCRPRNTLRFYSDLRAGRPR